MAYEHTSVDTMKSWGEICKVLYSHGCEATRYTETAQGFIIEFLRTKPTKHVAWGVLHFGSGRFDGWYFRHEDGLEMLDFFREEFPGERFALVSRTEKQRAYTGRGALRPHQSAQWLKAAS